MKRGKDTFYKQAKKEGYVARSAYKLEQLDKKFELFRKKKPGTVIEFGISPGSWYQYYAPKLHPEAIVIGVDQKSFKTQIRHGVFLEKNILDLTPEDVRAYIQGRVFIVLSDALPNLTGNRLQDRAKINTLRDHISTLGLALLSSGGHMVIKTYETPELGAWVKSLKSKFEKSGLEKPPASRVESPEMFFVGLRYSMP